MFSSMQEFTYSISCRDVCPHIRRAFFVFPPVVNNISVFVELSMAIHIKVLCDEYTLQKENVDCSHHDPWNMLSNQFSYYL